MSRSDIKENYVVQLSNRCYDMLHDQINKRNLIIGTWLTAFVAAFAFVFKEGKPSVIPRVIFLCILFVLSILSDVAVVTIAIWQSRYKKACLVCTELIMSDTELFMTKDVRKFIEKWYAGKKKAMKDKQKLKHNTPLSTTNIIITFCHVLPWVPVALMLEYFGYLFVTIPLLFILTCTYIAIVSRLHRKWYRERLYEIPWILCISDQDAGKTPLAQLEQCKQE